MISGAGSIISQEFGLPWLVGACTMAAATFITVLTGLGITAIGSVVPFLLAGVSHLSQSDITNGLHRLAPANPSRLWDTGRYLR